ncbi:MAG: M20/M25/M40 family metallo-hydrolase [Hyphomicrobiales bacterium]
MAEISPILAFAKRNLEHSLDRLCALLKLPTVSTDQAHSGDCLAGAQWLANELTALGFDASVRPTGGHPAVVAHYRPNGTSVPVSHVFFYGHYDVQPVDPLDEWLTPPFKPRIVRDKNGGGRIVARGAQDDKGQLMTFLEAVRAWIKVKGRLPLAVTILIEGEEEVGSPNLRSFLEANTEELSHDVALVCDTNMWDRETPAISTRLRGLLAEEIVVTGPSRDLHSGLYGGPARNPIRVLTRILGQLHDDGGQIAIAGFYDHVAPLSPDIKVRWDALDFSGSGFLGEVGLSRPAGESGFSVLEQLWSRPACDINGIVGGYTGEGTKTVIAAKAAAKISFRLVPDQNPEALRETFHDFVRRRIPDDCEVEFINHAASPAIDIPVENRYLKRAVKALDDEFSRPTVLMGCGGSIPIAASLREILKMDSLMVGFGLPDDRIHSPNEKYEISSFYRGIRSWIRILAELAAIRPSG